MTYKTYNIRKFISEFNFANPSWENLPPGFPVISKKGLTKEEGYLLDAIKFAYFTFEGGWRNSLKKSAKIGLISLIGIISLIGFITLIKPNSERLTKTVNAATIKIDEAIQSTMSAVLKK